jgi:hypothetical protein
MKFLLSLVCAVGALVVPALAGAQSLAPQTAWINDHGSVLVIQSIAPDGRLTGTYSNSMPGTPCDNVAFPLTGWVDGERITYSIRRKNASVDCGSVSSWTGYLVKGRIYAEWSTGQWDAHTSQALLTRGTDVYRPK